MRAVKREALVPIEVSRRNTRQRSKLMDMLVGYGEMLQKLASQDEEMRIEIERLGNRVKDANREEQVARENRQHHGLRRIEILAYRKKLAEQLSQTKNEILRTKRRLEK